MSEWVFKRDTAFRKRFFVPDSFAHPAKMDAQLLIKIVETYTLPGEVILDPMAGSGTTLLACTLGRNVILVELEEKFCKMCRDNWEIVKMHPQLGYEMGECQIIQGDARNLQGLADKIITSPPFADSEHHYRHGLKVLGKNFRGRKAWETKGLADKIITSPPYTGRSEHRLGYPHHQKDEERGYKPFKGYREGYSENSNNIGNLPYGQISKIITSPPYTNRMDGGAELQRGFKPYSGEATGWFTTRPQDNIGNLRYGNIDSIITSPLYEGTGHSQGDSEMQKDIIAKKHTWAGQEYSDSPSNIGNLKSATYLEAMLQVYQNCYKVLKDGGLMILVTKNFIRNKQVIRLDTDTIKLCEQAGFSYLHRHYRKLPSQSFWRILYARKYPSVSTIDYEDILVFSKPSVV